MEDERELTRDQNEGSGQQPPIGQQSDNQTAGQSGQQEQGQQASSSTAAGQGSEPPRSTGTRGTEFGQSSGQDETGQQGQSGTGQSDLGTQADTTLAGRADQQDLGQDQPGSTGGASGSQSERRAKGSSAARAKILANICSKAETPQAGFAEQGSGAPNQGSDIERDTERSKIATAISKGRAGTSDARTFGKAPDPLPTGPAPFLTRLFAPGMRLPSRRMA